MHRRGPATHSSCGIRHLRGEYLHAWLLGPRKQKNMPNPLFSIRRLRGCCIALNGIRYRITSVHDQVPQTWTGFKTVYDGGLPCLHIEPQFARVIAKQGSRFLWLGHLWLQPGHKGTIHAFAEIRHLGRVSGPNRWLRVPIDFPDVPAAELAARVPVPWRRRNTQPIMPAFMPSSGPLEPLEAEELIFDGPEVRQ
jgi:hypothetical protein